MQEIKKRRIVLTSVLKPVDEPRMFERMGQSLAENGHKVFIIGTTSRAKETAGIKFVPHDKINRISARRVLIRFKILKEIFSIKPDILIVSTHELLGVAIIYKVLTGEKIIYDVQENYWRNIVHTNAFPKMFRYLIAFSVRLKEIVASVFVSKLILAEQCYVDELNFIGKKYIVIENKCKTPNYFQRKPEQNSIQLLFSGTLAESTGVFKAIELTKRLHEIDSKIKLTIIGYCAQPKILQRLKNEIENHSFIRLIGGNEFVSHAEIINAMAVTHFGIVAYPIAPHITNKIPTKLYEYLSLQLPILLQDHAPWKNLCEPHQAAIVVNFNQFNAAELMTAMNSKVFYTSTPQGTAWQSEEETFLSAVNSVMP